jgi:hypothetical protein
VIHITGEPPKPATDAAGEAPSGQAAGGPEAGTAKPVFSETFLKKEFPHLYEKPAEGEGGQSQHPAQQLQTFLNGHGSKGWELVGVFPVGVLTMMFFRRPKPAAPAVSAVPPPKVEASLDGVLNRLEALEHQLSNLKPVEGTLATAGTLPETSPPAKAIEWVSPAQLASLAGETPVPSRVAAQAIGLRSASSLINHGARYGYTPGLSKVGPNGMVAIYSGAGSADYGGKERRLWIVVPAERLKG